MTSHKKLLSGGVGFAVVAATLVVGVGPATMTSRAEKLAGHGSAAMATTRTATAKTTTATAKTSKPVRTVFIADDARFDSAGRNIDRDIRAGVKIWNAQIASFDWDALQGVQLPGTTASHVRTLERLANRLLRDLNAVSAVTSVDRRAKNLALSFARRYLSVVAALAVLTSPSASEESKARAEEKIPLRAAQTAAKRANSVIGCTPSRCGGFFGKPRAFPAVGGGKAVRIAAASTPNASTPKCENCELRLRKLVDFYSSRINNASQGVGVGSGGAASVGDLFLVLSQRKEMEEARAKMNCHEPHQFYFIDRSPLTAVYYTSDGIPSHGAGPVQGGA